jgi:hypothetical protein
VEQVALATFSTNSSRHEHYAKGASIWIDSLPTNACHGVSPSITRENTPEGFDKIGAAGLDTVGKSDAEAHTEKNARCQMEIIKGFVFF